MVIDHRFEEGDARRASHHFFTVYPPRLQFAAQQRERQLETAAADDQLMMFLAALQRRRIGQRWGRQPHRRLAQMLIMPQPLAALAVAGGAVFMHRHVDQRFPCPSANTGKCMSSLSPGCRCGSLNS